MSSPLAPDLADEMKELAEFWAGDAQADRARAQFRALRAVARAAGALATYLQTTVPADEWMPVDARLARAYARLERLSGRKGET